MSTEPKAGLLASAARLGISLVSLAEGKVALFANELESERIWLLRLALRLLVAMLALTLAGAFAGLWLVYLLWEWNHWIALLAPVVLFASMGSWFWTAMLDMNAAKPAAFGQTRAELCRDRDALAASLSSGHD